MNKKLPLGLAASAVLAGSLFFHFSSAPAQASGGDDSVAARLGGYEGILAFLHERAVPAVLADPILAPFFSHLTVQATDIEECLARLLDHDLGGESEKNGEITSTGHECRSSMSKVHEGLHISPEVFQHFIAVVANEAIEAGITPEDLAVIGKRLGRYQGSITNK